MQHITYPEDVTDIRASHPHSGRRYLSIVPRIVVLAGQINGTPPQDADSKGLYQFNYDNVTDGVYTDVQPHMTVEFGTTSGGRDLGVARVRKAPTSSILYISEIDKNALQLADNVYFTVLEQYRPVVKLPRLVGSKDGTHFTNSFVEYHDYDRAYSNENENIPPKANAIGDNLGQIKFAGFVDLGQTYRTVVLDSSPSEWLGFAVASRAWDVGDGTITVGSVSSSSITARFPVGFRHVKLTVTSTNGSSNYIYIPIWVHDANNMPIFAFKVTGDSRREGREMSFEIFGDASSASTGIIPEGAWVCYWEVPKFKGIDAPRYYIHSFLGWVMEDTAVIKVVGSSYTMNVGGPAAWMQKIDGFSAVLEHTATPTDWYQMDGVDTDRCIWYIIREYSTFDHLISIHFSGLGNDIETETIQKGKLWDQIQTLAKTICGTAMCDSSGDLWFKRHLSYEEEADRPIIPSIAIEPEEWREADGITISTSKTEQISIVKATGSDYATGVSTVANAKAAGFVGNSSGREEELPYQRLKPGNPDTQIQALSGHHWARLDNKQREISINLLGNYDVIEPAWGEPISLTSTTANVRGTTITDEFYLVTGVNVQHSNEVGQAFKTITWTVEKVTIGVPGLEWVIASEDGATGGEAFFPVEQDTSFLDSISDSFFALPSGIRKPDAPPTCAEVPLIIVATQPGVTVEQVDATHWRFTSSTYTYDSGTGVYSYVGGFKDAYDRCFNCGFQSQAEAYYHIISCGGVDSTGVGGSGGTNLKLNEWSHRDYVLNPIDTTFWIECAE